ncbi:HMG domain-containing 3 isoform X2 [Labeo rohita]|uniref:HMG domain-containing 3 isoform X2 n=1 Tax=Labeo rohita TaxID=84645 RepID=A0A498NI35_LABRO|nr:HMG domain-containing 3 isoform X2 [Labeo rohita]
MGMLMLKTSGSSRGLVPSNKANPFVVRPSYHNWAPWIGPHTRSGDHLLNTEYEKVHSLYSVKEESEFTVTEDRLTDEHLKLKMEAVRSLCRQCGNDPKGSRMDLIGRLQQEMKNRASYDKVFSQIGSTCHRNSKTIENMKKRLGMGVEIVLNSYGQTMLASTKLPAMRTPQADVPGERSSEADAQAGAPSAAAAPAHGDTLGCSFVCCGLPHLEHIGVGSGILDSQLDDVLGPTKSATEVVGVLGTHNLTRWAFQTLGSNEELEARNANCCLEMICEIARDVEQC